MIKHKAGRIRAVGDDFEGFCSCGWKTGPKPLGEMAYGLLSTHVEEASGEEELVAKEADSFLTALDASISLSEDGIVTVAMPLAEAVRVRGLFQRLV